METRSENLPSDLFRPRTLAMLMGVYEANYRRLLELLGEPTRWSRRFALCLEERPVLHVEVCCRTRHTVDLVMTYCFDTERLPDLRVRLYRDARLAEAVPAVSAHAHNRPLAQLPARWRANLLLYKWLEFCLEAPPVVREPALPV